MPPAPSAEIAPDPSQADWRSFLRARRVLLLWLGVALALMMALISWELRSSYLDTRYSAQLAAQNLSLLLREQLDGALRETDLVLRDLAGKVDPATLARLRVLPVAERAALSQLLDEKLSTLPQVDNLAFVAPDGYGVLTHERLLPIDTHLQPFYSQLLDNGGLEMSFSKPFVLPGGNELGMIMARRIPGLDQPLGGVVTALVKLEYFNQLARRLDAQAGSSFTLYDANNTVVSRYPELKHIMGKTDSANAALTAWTNGRSSGYLIARSTDDGVERGYSFHRLDHFPFIVMVGLEEGRRFGDWHMKAAAYVCIFLLLIGFSLLMVWRGWRESLLALSLQANRQKLEQHDAHILRALETLSRPILLMRASDSRILVANAAAAALCGRSQAEMSTLSLPELYLRAEHHQTVAAQLAEKHSLSDYEIKFQRPDGSVFWAELSGSAIAYAGDNAYFLTLGDISARKQAQESLWRRATLDPLTSIANRGYLLERAQIEWLRAKRYRHPLAVLILDLDHFKLVNDNYGHPVGDEVLQAVTQRVQQTLRETDLFGRLGGEEFCVLLPEEGEHGMLENAERLRQVVAATPIVLRDGRSLPITVSIGCACSRPDTADMSQLLKQADQALYAAKHAGRNCVMAFSPSLDTLHG